MNEGVHPMPFADKNNLLGLFKLSNLVYFCMGISNMYKSSFLGYHCMLKAFNIEMLNFVSLS